ncbi:hypothetical protein WMY93_025029 [Mugilogobius chulae]|uniref:Coiled-coil domain-containing protein n=1 Tax=Mugilogobius chulae TaxID=88201 RepID=A0AAW0NDA5_9GOBI
MRVHRQIQQQHFSTGPWTHKLISRPVQRPIINRFYEQNRSIRPRLAFGEKRGSVIHLCRDFAVLEDHSLAYNLQEQEIESHLASNVHKSRLVQQDLQVAKRLQEEEDLRAKAQSRRQQNDIERQDTEIAHEIQEELVRQAEQQRQQEEKDAAIARKLHEKEMKDERKRQKQLETNFDEEYFEDQGARRFLDVDRPTKHRSLSPSHREAFAPLSPHRDYPLEHNSSEPKRNRHPKRDAAAHYSHSKSSEHSLEGESSWSRHTDPYPEHLSPRGKHGERYPNHVSSETGRHHTLDSERAARRKEKPSRPPPPQMTLERDTYDEYEHRDREGRSSYTRDIESTQDRGRSVDRLQDKERHKHKDPNRARTRSRDRLLDADYYDTRPGPSWEWPERGRTSWEEEGEEQERRGRGRRRVESMPDDVFVEHNDRGRKELLDSQQWESPTREKGHPNAETGRVLHKGSGEVVAETNYNLTEATRGLTKLDIEEQELKDREVARKLQLEELNTTTTVSRAAQVAQDEEIARLLMEQEKKEYKKQREREKERHREKERERERERERLDRMAAERKRYEAEYRPNSEEVVRPRTRDEYEYQRQKNQNKPSRPPQPRPHEYANVTPLTATQSSRCPLEPPTDLSLLPEVPITSGDSGSCPDMPSVLPLLYSSVSPPSPHA